MTRKKKFSQYWIQKGPPPRPGQRCPPLLWYFFGWALLIEFIKSVTGGTWSCLGVTTSWVDFKSWKIMVLKVQFTSFVKKKSAIFPNFALNSCRWSWWRCLAPKIKVYENRWKFTAMAYGHHFLLQTSHWWWRTLPGGKSRKKFCLPGKIQRAKLPERDNKSW